MAVGDPPDAALETSGYILGKYSLSRSIHRIARQYG